MALRSGCVRLVLACLICSVLIARDANAEFLGPTPYLSFADSPFANVAFDSFTLEDLEDGAFDPVGATASAGWIVNGPGAQTDSVDGDDGVIDGSGTGGHSFYSGQATSSLTITFDAPLLGGLLPTHAGIVWTDVGSSTPTSGFDDVTFSALDASGVSLGSIGPFLLGDGLVTGETAEDRFFGVVNLAGISSFTITMSNSVDWEVDHVQFGTTAIPEPSGLALISLGAGVVLLRRRLNRRRRLAS